MERITSVNQLSKGDRIARIENDGSVTLLEFISIHPHHNGYSLMLDSNKDGAPKFYNHDLERYVWYLYKDTNEWWIEMHQMLIDFHKKKIASQQERIEHLKENIKKGMK